MTKMIWKARDALSTVRAPNNHDSPKSDMMPIRLIMSRIVEALSLDLFFLMSPRLLLRLWRINTTITMINTTELKTIMAKIGARKAAKNVAVLPMKHLLNKSNIKSFMCIYNALYSQSMVVSFRFDDGIISINC